MPLPNRRLPSATLSLIEGCLGKNDPLVVDLHQFRGQLSQEAQQPAGGNS